VVGALRYLTILWPGLPWLWLRGSLPGLVLALAFAVTLDVAMLTTWIWTDLVDLPFRIAAWSGAAAIWLLGTLSALSAFPPAVPVGRSPSIDARFEEARNAYLARDWIGAEERLREMLRLAPTDGEAQLLLGTLLRRVGRLPESRAALEALARSDAGARWRTAIARELSLVAAAERQPAESADDAAILPLSPAGPSAADRVAA
jgi:tetratricopeptide (TPR) repeat protein